MCTCVCAHIYGHSILHLLFSPYYHNMDREGKTSYSTTCPTTVGTILLWIRSDLVLKAMGWQLKFFFFFFPIEMLGNSRKKMLLDWGEKNVSEKHHIRINCQYKKKSFWNNGSILLSKLQNWLHPAFPRFMSPDNCSTTLWAQELDFLVVELLKALKCPSLGQLPWLNWPRISAPGNLMVRLQGYLEIFKPVMQVCFTCMSSELYRNKYICGKKNQLESRSTVL